MTVQINAEDCTACEACIDECPTEALYLDGDKIAVKEDECTDCGACVDVCPTEVLSLP